MEKKNKHYGEQKVPYVEGDVYSGLTKREYFAGLAMQGIMARKTEMDANGATTMNFAELDKDIARESVSIADALLNELSN